MKTYDKYKQSGIEWIGKIPEHWEESNLGRIGEFTASGIDKKILPTEEKVKIINYTDVYGNKDFILNSNFEFMEVSAPKVKILEHRVKRGDMIFTPSSETIEDIGISALVDEDLENTAYSYHVLRFRSNNEISHHFKKYICNNNIVLSQFSKKAQGTTRKTLDRNDFKTTKVLLPPLHEQTAIADYLDRKTAEIDELIADKKRLLELYDEEKTAVINQAVTKGLTADGKGLNDYADENNQNTEQSISEINKSKKSTVQTVKMKDSGIEWLGEIPEHWEVKKIKWVHQTTSGGTPKSSNSEYYNGKIPWLRTLDLNNDNVNDCEIYISELALEESSAKIVPKYSVLIAMYGGAGTIGKSGLLIFDAAINQALCAILPNSNTNSKFLHYFIRFFRPYWMIGAEGTRRDPNISQDDIKNNPFLFPPIQEQQQIVEYIEKEMERIDTKIDRTKKLIELLEEYRTALISEVVTGKVKVVP